MRVQGFRANDVPGKHEHRCHVLHSTIRSGGTHKSSGSEHFLLRKPDLLGHRHRRGLSAPNASSVPLNGPFEVQLVSHHVYCGA